MDKFSEFKAAEFKINNATKVSFDTCYSAMIALDLARHGSWTRSVYQMGRMYMATREFEAENAKQLSYDDAYALYKVLNEMSEVRPQAKHLALSFKKLADAAPL